jgi:flagellar biosynthesis/type III secretory pathway ATPase
LGAYVAGTNAKLDAVIRMRPELLRFLQQGSRDESKLSDTLAGLRQLASLLP